MESKLRYGSTTAESFSGFYRDNMFNFPDQHKSSRVQKRDISTGLQSLRSVSSLRSKFYKTDGSQILAEVCTGNKPKGFIL